MKVRSIRLDEEENPSAVTVTMTINEAAYITKVIGKLNDAEAEQVMNDGASLSREIYYCLIGSVFNRFWNEGIDGFKG